jgi:hypothetical protein|tara:strand:- start:898 stop:1110 length:213 start_codon:yes stop_codon:yes gene_type:complete
MIYAQAIPQAIISMGPTYIQNIYVWLKMALWDAPYRVWLDIELEKLSIERTMCNHSCEHDKEKDCDEKCE